MESNTNTQEIDEVFKIIPFAKDYSVSNYGNVISYKHNKPHIMKPLKGNGYLSVELCFGDGTTKKIGIHRLVAIMFIPNKDNKEEVNHIDGNPFNNRVENLEWVSRKENMEHCWNILHCEDTKKVHQYSINGEYLATYRSARIASEMTGTHRHNIVACCTKNVNTANNYIWSYEKHELITPYVNPKHRPCVVFDKYGNFIGKFKTAKQAAVQFGLNPTVVSRCCNMKGSSGLYKGYVFKYSDTDDFQIFISQINTAIERKTLHNIHIKTYKSCIEASTETNIPFVYILRNCNGETSQCFGSIYKFYN